MMTAEINQMKSDALRRLVWIIASIVPMDAVSGNHLCVTLMMIVEMDRMKLVVIVTTPVLITSLNVKMENALISCGSAMEKMIVWIILMKPVVKQQHAHPTSLLVLTTIVYHGPIFVMEMMIVKIIQMKQLTNVQV